MKKKNFLGLGKFSKSRNEAFGEFGGNVFRSHFRINYSIALKFLGRVVLGHTITWQKTESKYLDAFQRYLP